MAKKLKTYNLSNLSYVVLLSLCITRVLAISLFYVLNKHQDVAHIIVNDPLHHYHFGIFLILVGLLLSKLKNVKILLPIGLGILLEEWPVLFNDLGLNTNHLYQNGIDFVIVFVLVGLVYLLSKCTTTKK